MDNTLTTPARVVGAGAPRHAAPRHAAPRQAAPSLAGPSLGAEVRATLVLFGTVLLVILGVALASTLALRLLAS